MTIYAEFPCGARIKAERRFVAEIERLDRAAERGEGGNDGG